MNILKIVNDKQNVLLDDSQTCAFLKYRLTFSGVGDFPEGGWQVIPNWEYKIFQKKEINMKSRGSTSMMITIMIPIAHRDTDEYYIYSVASASPLEMISMEERMAVDSTTGLKKPMFGCRVAVPYTTDIGSILRGLEIYVYSNKTSHSEKYGMEVFDEKGKPVFNSANYYLRAKNTLFKRYTDAVANSDKFKGSHTYDVTKLGITVGRSAYGQLVGIDGNVVYTYPDAGVPANFFELASKYSGTLQYIVSELAQHKHFPVSVDLAEI